MEGICSEQETLGSLEVLGAGHSVWHWDMGPVPGACAGPGGILCHAGSKQWSVFFSGSSMEMCNPDMAASGRIITAPLGRTAGMGEAQGQVGKLSFID